MVRAICSLHESWDPDRYAMLDDVVDRYARWLPQRARDPRSVFLVSTATPSSVAATRPVPQPAGPPISAFLVGEILTNIPIYRVTEYGFIHDLWVDPLARRAGTGKALVTAAIDRFRAMGAPQIRLETALANGPARQLFESCGFRTSTIDMILRL